jgi:aminocarboxymuconate-semialdehyde decarboxylase
VKIDIYSHVMLPKYRDALYRYSDKFPVERAVQERRPALTDRNVRLQTIEPFDDMLQVVSTTMPPLEETVDAGRGIELARICNDEMAEMVASDPARYAAAVANLPLNDIDASIREAQRAIEELGFKGIQIYTRVNGKPPSSPEFFPLYELMVGYDLPVWLHPMRGANQPDYATEATSFNQIFSIFGWPFDTTVAMTRFVFAGIFEKFPSLKIITHHCGGMAPYFADRLAVHYGNGLERLGTDNFPGLTRPPVEYFKMFYADTALNGNPHALHCGLDFFGEDHVLFGTDMPYDVENGAQSIRQTIDAIDSMGITDLTRSRIYEGNARLLLKL